MQNYLSELFPLSWLSQYAFCPRRCSLLALEQVWQENEYTAAGRAQHERAHDARTERRGSLISIYDLGIFSHALGVSGKCDCIEATENANGVTLPFGSGRYMLYPVEYKHGIVRDEEEYHIQLCAQAICLEELYGARISAGAIFFIDAHRRDEVDFSDTLRMETQKTAKAVSEMIINQKLFPAEYSVKCKKCSLFDVCQPHMKISAKAYCDELWHELTNEGIL